MKRHKINILTGCLVGATLIMQASVASAVWLDVNSMAYMSDGGVTISNASLGGATTFGVGAVYDGSSWQATTDLQYSPNAAQAVATPLTGPAVASAVGSAVDSLNQILGYASAYNDGINTTTAAGYSKAYSYQFFNVLNSGAVTASYDYNGTFSTMQDSTGPAVFGSASIVFGLGKLTFDQQGIAHFDQSTSSTPWQYSGLFDGTNDFDSGLLTDSLTYNFAAGDIGFLFAESTAFASTDLNLLQPSYPDPNPVPEPGTFVLLGAGLVGLVAYRRRHATAV